MWFFNIRKTSKQLKELMDVSNQVAKGNLLVKSSIVSKDEIGMLAKGASEQTLEAQSGAEKLSMLANQINTLRLIINRTVSK